VSFVAITGASGLIGRLLTETLRARGTRVRPLVRREASGDQIHWDPAQGTVDREALEGASAVIHRAGENVGAGRWSEARKKRILDSRVQGTGLIASCVAQMSIRPACLISASAVGWYGSRGDETLDETASGGDDFLAGVCAQWEASTQAASDAGIRVVHARMGVVLDPEGGALAKMLLPFKMGAGGRVGDGHQWMSWISRPDVVNALIHLMNDETMRGPVNIVAPKPVTNVTFTRALGKALRRPTLFPVPAMAIKTMFGEMGEATVLASQRALPGKLTAAGFAFEHSTVDAALKAALR
jgi:uncharacterized protein